MKSPRLALDILARGYAEIFGLGTPLLTGEYDPGDETESAGQPITGNAILGLIGRWWPKQAPLLLENIH